MKKLITLLSVFVLSTVTALANPGTISLLWDAPAGPTPAGYKIYFGESSGNYTQSMNATGATPVNDNGQNSISYSATLPASLKGRTVYAVVTALHPGIETGYSNEISFFFPENLQNFRFQITISGTATIPAPTP